jgi:hypothetical protein
MFVRFKNVVFPKQLMDGFGLADMSEALPERRLLWDLFKQSITDGTQDANSLDEMLKTIFIQGLRLPIVDSYVDSEGYTVFIIMSRMLNVYKILVWTAAMNHDFIQIGVVMDTQTVSKPVSDVARTPGYRLVFPNIDNIAPTSSVDGVPKSSEWADVKTLNDVKYYVGNENFAENIKLVNRMFHMAPEYVGTLLSLTLVEYCSGMFNDVKNSVSHIVSQL